MNIYKGFGRSWRDRKKEESTFTGGLPKYRTLLYSNKSIGSYIRISGYAPKDEKKKEADFLKRAFPMNDIKQLSHDN